MGRVLRSLLLAGTKGRHDRNLCAGRGSTQTLGGARSAAARSGGSQIPLWPLCPRIIRPAQYSVSTWRRYAHHYRCSDAGVLRVNRSGCHDVERQSVFVEDGNATFSDWEHNAALSAMAHSFCDVISTDAIIAMVCATASAPLTRVA